MLKRLKNIFSNRPAEELDNKKFSTRNLSGNILYKESSPFDRWKLIKVLGDGAFGKVHQALDETNNKLAAVKVIDDIVNDELAEHLIEIDILKDCQHKNIIEFYEAYLFQKKLFIFLEFCTFGAVDQMINTLEHGLTEKQIVFIGHEILLALNYLHNDRFVIHRDVKASNILIGKTGQVKLADFGISVKNSSLEQKQNEYIGTAHWMAPEVFFCEADNNQYYDYRVDIWSFGICLIEMAEMDPPHHELRRERVGAKIRQAPPPTLKEPGRWTEQFLDVLSCCLKRNPEERLNCQSLLEHKFFQNAPSFHPSILYLIEEFKATPTVEIVNDEQSTESNPINSTTEEQSPSEFVQPRKSIQQTDSESNSSSSSSEEQEEDQQLIEQISSNILSDFDQQQKSTRIILNEIRRLSTGELVQPDCPEESIIVQTKLEDQNGEVENFQIKSDETTNETTVDENPVDEFDREEKINQKDSRRSSVNSQTVSIPQENPKILTTSEFDSEEKRLMGVQYKIDRLSFEDFPENKFETIFQMISDEIIDEVLQSDNEQPSIPEAILSVIIELTQNDQTNPKTSKETQNYYSNVKSSVSNKFIVENFDKNFSSKSSTKIDQERQKLKITRKFVTSDGQQQEIVMEKPIEPLKSRQFQTNERKEAQREFRRLYQIEKLLHEQLIHDQEEEIHRQQQQFNKKLEDLEKQFDVELESIDLKYRINMKNELIRRKSRSIQFDESNLNDEEINSQHRKSTEEKIRFQKMFGENFDSTKTNGFRRKMNLLEENYKRERINLLKLRENSLWKLESDQLQLRYDLLRKKTKEYYSIFYKMLTEQSNKELNQFDQRTQFEREKLLCRFVDAQNDWSNSWKKVQQVRFHQFQQEIRSNRKTIQQSSEDIRRFENNENKRFSYEQRRLQEKHHGLIRNLHQQQKNAREELLLVQKQKLDKCIEFETRKLEELQRTFETDWFELQQRRENRQSFPTMISTPFSNGKLFRSSFSRNSSKKFDLNEFEIVESPTPVVLRSNINDRASSWHSWPQVDFNFDQKFLTLSNNDESILF